MAFNVNMTVTGLTTVSIGIPVAAETPISGKLSLPTLTTGATATSQCVVTITQTPNGGGPTTIYTGQAGAEGFALIANCAALDTIAITTSSSAPVDQQLNSIKTTISVG